MIDCSKISNKGDLVVLAAVLMIFTAFAVAITLTSYTHNFIAGFFSATIVWKWRDWIYRPIDRVLDKLWVHEVPAEEER